MTLSATAKNLISQITHVDKLGDLRKMAAQIKKEHQLAEELWSAQLLFPRLLAILIMDPKQLSSDVIDRLIVNIEQHPMNERLQLTDWLMANQLTKNKKVIELIESWKQSTSALKRRIFWYYQGRLRWVGQKPPANTEKLLSSIEKNILKEPEEVGWAMNFTAAWIGIFQPEYRDRCADIGHNTGLYKDEIVARGCTPNFLPKFIEIETKKRGL
ncbi:MAG: DNA alkylation repair protein [Flavobacterium sp.]|nr:DNA alkylation repair protein [Flavobacterium sp.]